MTRQERNTFLEDQAYYLSLGYPQDIATNYAYDHYYINRKAAQTAYNVWVSPTY